MVISSASWLVGWYYRPRPRDGGTVHCAMELQQCAEESGKDGKNFYTTQREGGHPIAAQAAAMDGFPSVASC